MISVKVGDLFESQAQTLVNTVNTVGVMGKGIALEFKKRYPAMFEDYRRRCAVGEVKLGRPYLYRELVGKWILNFPTKDHWRSVARLQDIIDGLAYLREHYREWGIRSLALPPLGCGEGQLEWRVVGPTLYRHLSQLDIPVELYAPHGTPEQQLTKEFLSTATPEMLVGASTLLGSRIDPAWVALVEILARVTREPYHWPVGRTVFHKIAYFATAAGLPTGLHYEKGSFGPFAPRLKRIVTALVNQGLIEEKKSGNAFLVRSGPTFADARRLATAEIARWDEPIANVTDLFLRMSGRDAEVAATVHFAAEDLNRQGRQASEIDVRDAVLDWKQRRKPPLERRDIENAIRHLNILGWVRLTPSAELDPEDDEVAIA